MANESYVVSFGHRAGDLNVFGTAFSTDQFTRLINVANGIHVNDAVNLGQLNAVGAGVATSLGGGAAWNPLTSNFTAPAYTVQGATHNNVGDALTALDTAITAAAGSAVTQADIEAGNATTLQSANDYTDQQIANASGVALDAANDYTDTRETAIRTDMAAGDAQTLADAKAHADAGDATTLQSANTYTDQKVTSATGAAVETANAYTDSREAVVRTDMAAGNAQTLSAAQSHADAGDTRTLNAANAYTDTRFNELTRLSDSFEAYRGQVDQRFAQQDRRIDKLASISGAYAGMAMNTAGLAGQNRIGVGIGTQGGEQALAVGYQRAIGNRASVSIAGAFSGDEKSVSAGAGFSW